MTAGLSKSDPYTPGDLLTVGVCVDSASEELGQSTDESYTLQVGADGSGTLEGKTIYGTLRGMETLAQLVSFIRPGRISNLPIHIEDKPAFQYRGLMVNPAGQFMPVSFLKRVVDGLVLNKMNVLHVHWSDVTSFPIASEKFPQLAEKGKMGRLVRGPLENATVYTKADIRDLVDYARQRGVRIIPEFGASSSPTCPSLRLD